MYKNRFHVLNNFSDKIKFRFKKIILLLLLRVYSINARGIQPQSISIYMLIIS